jgi:hypothetical protein
MHFIMSSKLFPFLTGLAVGLLLMAGLLIIVFPTLPDPSPGTVPCSDDFVSEPYAPLPSSYASNLISNYRNNHWTFINSAMHSGSAGSEYTAIAADFNDSRSVWFDLKKLKRFIYEIESKSCTANVNSHLGLRFYYGQYPCDFTKNPDFSGIPALYQGLHTLIMMPTYDDANGYHVDFDPTHVDGNGVPEVVNCEWDNLTLLAPKLTMMNHGTLVPPPATSIGEGALMIECIDKRNSIREPENPSQTAIKQQK